MPPLVVVKLDVPLKILMRLEVVAVVVQYPLAGLEPVAGVVLDRGVHASERLPGVGPEGNRFCQGPVRDDPSEVDEDRCIVGDQREKGTGILRQRLPLGLGVRPDSFQPSGITAEILTRPSSRHGRLL